MNRFSTLSVPRSEPAAGSAVLGNLWAILAGLLVPILVVLIGVIAVLLNQGSLIEPRVHLGRFLSVPLPSGLLNQSPLVQLSELTILALVIACIFCLTVWLNRRDADARSRRIAKELHSRVLSQSLKRAELEGAAAQHVRAENLIGSQLPRVQSGLSMWYRVMPRNLLMLLSCVGVALLVNVWLAILGVISGVLVWRLYQWLRIKDDADLSHWEVPRTRQRMAELVGRAPLLARLQSHGIADDAFASELETLYRRLAAEDYRQARVWPLLFLASAFAIAVLLLGLGVNLLGEEAGIRLRDETGLSLPAALVLGLALSAAAVSVGRLVQLTNYLRIGSRASEAVYLYLQRSDESTPSEQRVGLAGIRDGVTIHDVTISDSAGKPILSHLSLTLTPGSMVAVLGTDSVSTRALTELLMGFGRPNEGRVEIDGIHLLDVHPQALAKNVMWVEPGGPIWEGTIQENLKGGDESIHNTDIVETLENVGVYEQIQRLPDGLSTIITSGDSSLGVEHSYAIGVARAILHKPPIVLAMEPPAPAEHMTEDPCLNALRKLASDGSLIVMLPRRLSTLRAADRVVLLNGPRLAGEGRHAELVADSDLYRHMNYLLFNPYRPQKQA